MILVDSSIWIDYWSKESSAHAQALKVLIEEDHAAINGLIYTEVTQGSRNEKEFAEISHLLTVVPLLSFGEDHWIKSSRLFFSLKRRGLNVTTIDCLIAQHTITESIPLFSKDKIFGKISRYSELKRFVY